MEGSPAGPPPGPLGRLENGLAAGAFLVMGVLPVLEILFRTLADTGVPGSLGYVTHLTLWVGFLGALIATRERQHLSLVSGILPPRLAAAGSVAAALGATAVCAALTWASIDFVRVEREAPTLVAGWMPVWWAELVLPLCFGVSALRFVRLAGDRRAQAIASLGFLVAGAFWVLGDAAAPLAWPGIVLLVLLAPLGAPIFVIMGGIALLLFMRDGVPVASIPVQAYTIVVSPSIPTIPLFTLAGYVLAEGKAGTRLVRVFQALCGWMPGGLAVMATLVCAFFTTFTGASGVTILALGGLLMPALLAHGYKERFSLGLLTATGSLGLLFPPCLPVILYAVSARVPIPDLFKAAALPGMLLVLAVSLYSLREGVRSGAPRQPFSARELASAAWAAKWELFLPAVTLYGMFGGMTTLIEASAITVVYAIVTQTFVHGDLSPTRDLPRILLKCATLIGGVFIILGVAMGLTSYLIDAEVPMHAAAWVEAHVASRFVFLAALNVFLLIVGCLMDIYSAIAVVVPLIIPISQVFGIDPLHLGVIFLANLELGYLTPPVGMNLFLSSYRFEKPLHEVYRASVPFLLLLLGMVLVITYVPSLTTWVNS